MGDVIWASLYRETSFGEIGRSDYASAMLLPTVMVGGGVCSVRLPPYSWTSPGRGAESLDTGAPI